MFCDYGGGDLCLKQTPFVISSVSAGDSRPVDTAADSISRRLHRRFLRQFSRMDDIQIRARAQTRHLGQSSKRQVRARSPVKRQSEPKCLMIDTEVPA